MNQQERNALREKHRMHTHDAERGLFCRFCDSRNEWDWCKSCRLKWPCDTIKVLDAWADTTEYPPEGQNAECDHTDENGLCWCESGLLRCPECREWFGHIHAKKAILYTPECDVHDDNEVSTTREECDHADRIRIAYSDVYYVDIGYRYCPKCGNKLDNG